MHYQMSKYLGQKLKVAECKVLEINLNYFNLNGERITNHSTGCLSLRGPVMLTVVPLKPPGRESEREIIPAAVSKGRK